jgi:hypothetical protein
MSSNWLSLCEIQLYFSFTDQLPILQVRVQRQLQHQVLNTILCNTVCQRCAVGWWFSPGTLFATINITDVLDITTGKLLLKVVLNTQKQYKS